MTSRGFPCAGGGLICSALVAALTAAVPGCQKMNLAAFGMHDSKPKIEKSHPPDKDSDQIADRPATPKTVYAFARILASKGQDSTCNDVLTKLIREHPRYKAAYLLQAEVRMRLRRFDDAAETLYNALRLWPRDDVIWNNLGMCFLMKPDCPTALTRFTAAAAIRPGNARYRANMALALGLMGREEESLSLYTMVMPANDAQHNLSVLTSARQTFNGPGDPPLPVLIGDGGLRQNP